MTQLALLPPWWSESRHERVAGDRQLVRYRCRRCAMWSDPIDSRKAAPGACRGCVPLPLEVPEPPAAYLAQLAAAEVAPQLGAAEPERVELEVALPFPLQAARLELLQVLEARAAALSRRACRCELRDRRWDIATGCCGTCGDHGVALRLEAS